MLVELPLRINHGGVCMNALSQGQGAPVLTVWGANYQVAAPENAEQPRRLPIGQVWLIEQCGRVPQVEVANLFNVGLLDFLQPGEAENRR